MAAELARPMSVPTVSSPEGRPSSGGGSGLLGPAGSPPAGVTLGYPSGLAGPIELETQVTGQRMLSPPAMEMTTTTSLALALSGSGIPGPNAGVCTPAAAATVTAKKGPSPAARRWSQSLQLYLHMHAKAAAEGLTLMTWSRTLKSS